MLEATRRTGGATGTNRRDDLAWADPRFLLPAPELGRVLFLGRPRLGRLAAFAARADEVLVVCPERADLGEIRRAARRRGLPGIHFLSTVPDSMPLKAGSVSVAMVVSRRAVRELGRSPSLADELDRVLAGRGAVCLETGLAGRRRASAAVSGLAERGFAGPRRYWPVPPTGPTRAFLPRGDLEVARHFFDEVLQGRSLRKRAVLRLGGWLARTGLLRLVLHRTLVVLWRAGRDRPRSEPAPAVPSRSERPPARPVDGRPPGYLASLLREHGLDPDGLRAGFSLHGAYNSSKVVCFLFPRGEGTPEAVVKLPRAPRYNHRLENEGRALALLAREELLPAGAYPERLFLGRAGGLAVLGQGFVDGVSFRRGTEGHPGCPRAREAVETLIRLGETSAEPGPGSGAGPDRSDALRELFEGYLETYRPDRTEARFLSDRLSVLTGAGRGWDGVPAVVQHGDPGVWNVRLRPGGGVTFLDWESAGPGGMPLWDLFYFLRSFATWIHWLRGERDLQEAHDRYLLEDGPFATLQARAVSRYCRRVGVAPEAVEPLFYLCWMHRALKEAARLPDGDLEGGLYRRLLRRSVARRDAAGLRLLFDAGRTEAGRPAVERPPATRSPGTVDP